jgi:hypothetical protein
MPATKLGGGKYDAAQETTLSTGRGVTLVATMTMPETATLYGVK